LLDSFTAVQLASASLPAAVEVVIGMTLARSGQTDSTRPLDEVLSELADLGKIPQEKRKAFSDFMTNSLLDIRAISERPHNEEAVSKAVKAAHKLKQKLANLDPKDREKLVYQSFEDEIDCFLEITMDWYARLRYPRLRTSRKDRVKGVGRPKGTLGYPRLRHLVLDLAYVAKWAGGGFTYDRNYPKKGTLKKALEQLRPYVPARVVPSTLPPAIGIWIAEANNRDREDLANLVTKLSRIMSFEAATREAKRLMDAIKGLTINSMK
jgi:hypothetical protein